MERMGGGRKREEEGGREREERKGWKGEVMRTSLNDASHDSRRRRNSFNITTCVQNRAGTISHFTISIYMY